MPHSTRAGVVRTCAGCRQEVSREKLERFEFHPSVGLLHDIRQKSGGRGVWVHPEVRCLRQARRGGFSRGVKGRVVIDDEAAWLEEVRAAIIRRIKGTLGEALRRKEAAIGQTILLDVLKENRVVVIFLAANAGKSTEAKFVSNAARKGIETIRLFTGEELGSMTGREYVSVIGVLDRRIGERILEDQRRQIGLLDHGG